MSRLLIGHEHSDFIKAEFRGRPYADGETSFDRNQLEVWLEIAVRPIAGSFQALWRAETLHELRGDLEALYESLEGQVGFQPDYNGSLALTFRGDGIGHVSVRGEACANAADGPWVRFQLTEIDQTYLPEIIGALAELEREYPVL